MLATAARVRRCPAPAPETRTRAPTKSRRRPRCAGHADRPPRRGRPRRPASRRRRCCTDDPRASSHRRAGSAYSASSGTRGNPMAASDRVPLNIAGQHPRKGRGGGRRRRLVQRGHHQRLPEQLAQPGRLAALDEPRFGGLGSASRAHVGRPSRAWPDCRSTSPMRSAARRSRRPSADHRTRTAHQVQRRWPRRSHQPAARGRGGRRSRCPAARRGSRRRMRRWREGSEGLVIAAKQRVLAVVDDLAGLRVRKRGRAPAEPSALLDARAHARRPGPAGPPR